MKLTEEEMIMIKSACGGYEWNDVCDAIKEARNGQYPPDWFEKVLGAGLIEEAINRVRNEKDYN